MPLQGQIEVKVRYVAIESTEWDHVWKFGAHEHLQESWRLTWDLANSIHLPETQKIIKPTGGWDSITITLIKSGCLYTIYVCHWRNTCSIPGTFEHLVFYVGCKCLHNIPDEIGEKTWEFLAGMKQTMINKCRLAGYLTCHLFDAQLFVLE